jgi:endoglucanase Acf2
MRYVICTKIEYAGKPRIQYIDENSIWHNDPNNAFTYPAPQAIAIREMFEAISGNKEKYFIRPVDIKPFLFDLDI